jgi:hypothetical protein
LLFFQWHFILFLEAFFNGYFGFLVVFWWGGGGNCWALISNLLQQRCCQIFFFCSDKWNGAQNLFQCFSVFVNSMTDADSILKICAEKGARYDQRCDAQSKVSE